jgi:S-adenosylmethionine:tRNA ribosyltransferase-isomerase
MPSAGRPLAWEILDALRRRGVALATLTHAAGISSTGEEAIDRALPLVERYEIPPETAAKIAARRGRVVAVGTSVVRALESSARAHGRVIAETNETALRLGPHTEGTTGNRHGRLKIDPCGQGCEAIVGETATERRVVDALLTGIHDDPATSHHALLEAFAPRALLDRAHAHAARADYVGHELGDATLVIGS